MEWKPIRLWFGSISTLPVFYNILKFGLGRFKDCQDSPRFVHTRRIFCVKNFVYACWQENKDIVHNSKRLYGAQNTIQRMDMWFRGSTTAHYLCR